MVVQPVQPRPDPGTLRAVAWAAKRRCRARVVGPHVVRLGALTGGGAIPPLALAAAALAAQCAGLLLGGMLGLARVLGHTGGRAAVAPHLRAVVPLLRGHPPLGTTAMALRRKRAEGNR